MVFAGCEGMPQLDFQKVFIAPGDAPGLPEQILPNESANFTSRRTLPVRPRLDRSEWANISFATVALAGGLFCAFYFFNGTDVVRAAAAWSREFLYPRPADPMSAIAASREQSEANDGKTTDAESSKSSSESSGPFERNIWPNQTWPRTSDFGFLTPVPDGTNGSPSPSASSIPPSLPGPPPTVGGTFTELNLLAHSADALFQALYKTLPSQNSDSVRLVTKVVRHSRRAVAGARKKALSATRNMVRQPGSTAESTIQNGQKSASNARSAISATSTSATSGGSSALNSGSNPGGAAGLGTMSSGLNGASRGLGVPAGGMLRGGGVGLGGGRVGR